MVYVLAGTIIGEIITFFMFRSCLRSRAEKMEHGKGSLRWASLGRVIREGGFTTALVVRYSAIPTHSESCMQLVIIFSVLKLATVITALFAVTGITFRIFALTLALSLPRQLAGVQIGGRYLSIHISQVADSVCSAGASDIPRR